MRPLFAKCKVSISGILCAVCIQCICCVAVDIFRQIRCCGRRFPRYNSSYADCVAGGEIGPVTFINRVASVPIKPCGCAAGCFRASEPFRVIGIGTFFTFIFFIRNYLAPVGRYMSSISF